MNGDQVFATVRWCVADLEDVFKENGISFTEDNIKTFLNSNSPNVLRNICIQYSWEILDHLVSSMKSEGKFSKGD